MATANQFDLHDHAGARWLAPFLAVVLATVVIALAMLIYPHRMGY
jgi:hypothetical protein